MKVMLIIIFALLCRPVAAAEPLDAETTKIEIALTDNRVAVDTGFAGARLTLFGAVTGIENPAASLDIISVIRGPDARFNVRRMQKNNLIWTPGKSHIISNAPRLHLTNSNRPISDIAPLPLQAEHRLGTDYLNVTFAPPAPDVAIDAAEEAVFREAFVTETAALGLYRARIGGIEFKKGALFTIKARLPANTPVGDYSVAVYLFRNGVLLGSDSAVLAVNRVGMERRIYDLAHRRPVSYGIFCVALALIAGWAASAAFRK